jgi:hypothetical protein
VGTLLIRGTVLCLALCAGAAMAAESDRHQWRIDLEAGYVASDSPLGSWPSGGLGKLRYAEDEDAANAMRLFAQYRGRITPTLTTTIIADYVDDASGGLDLDEAFVDWRPIPKSPNQQQVRFGMFYPPLSLENTTAGWQSPFTYSYSAINTWLGEEIRPIGAEWSLRRRLGQTGSPHELRTFASAFFGNDPAATLLFWRGWSLHDRQTRLNDRLEMPPMPVFNSLGSVVGTRQQIVEPFEEIDHEPGAYAGVEWRYGKRALVQFAYYDNRADAEAFKDGQWAWDTAFTSVGAQVSLPADVGLVAQWLGGRTYWLVGGRPDGTRSFMANVVEDGFDSWFVLLTRVFRGSHRVSLRYDDFEIVREEAEPAFVADTGDAWTFAYRYERSERLSAGLEWLEIESQRDSWTDFYGLPRDAVERQIRLQVSLKYGAPRAR